MVGQLYSCYADVLALSHLIPIEFMLLHLSIMVLTECCKVYDIKINQVNVIWYALVLSFASQHSNEDYMAQTILC